MEGCDQTVPVAPNIRRRKRTLLILRSGRPRVQADPVYAHNDYVQFLAEYGIVGAIGLVLFLAGHLRGGWKALATKFRVNHKPWVWAASLALSTGALSATTRMVPYLSISTCTVRKRLGHGLCLWRGLILAVKSRPARRSEKAAFGCGVNFGSSPGLGLCTLILAMPKLPAEIYGERKTGSLRWLLFVSPEMAQDAENYALLGLQYDLKNSELHYYLGEAEVARAIMATDPAEKRRLFGECVEAYQNARALAPRDTRLILCLATSLDALERFDEAAPLYARVLEVDPYSIYAYWAYGMHFELQQKFDEAEAAYRRSLALGVGPWGGARADRADRISHCKTQPPAPLPLLMRRHERSTRRPPDRAPLMRRWIRSGARDLDPFRELGRERLVTHDTTDPIPVEKQSRCAFEPTLHRVRVARLDHAFCAA